MELPWIQRNFRKESRDKPIRRPLLLSHVIRLNIDSIPTIQRSYCRDLKNQCLCSVGLQTIVVICKSLSAFAKNLMFLLPCIWKRQGYANAHISSHECFAKHCQKFAKHWRQFANIHHSAVFCKPLPVFCKLLAVFCKLLPMFWKPSAVFCKPSTVFCKRSLCASNNMTTMTAVINSNSGGSLSFYLVLSYHYKRAV